jgi:hypothetical protein
MIIWNVSSIFLCFSSEQNTCLVYSKIHLLVPRTAILHWKIHQIFLKKLLGLLEMMCFNFSQPSREKWSFQDTRCFWSLCACLVLHKYPVLVNIISILSKNINLTIERDFQQTWFGVKEGMHLYLVLACCCSYSLFLWSNWLLSHHEDIGLAESHHNVIISVPNVSYHIFLHHGEDQESKAYTTEVWPWASLTMLQSKWMKDPWFPLDIHCKARSFKFQMLWEQAIHSLSSKSSKTGVQHATFQEKEAWLNQGDPVTQQSSLSK